MGLTKSVVVAIVFQFLEFSSQLIDEIEYLWRYVHQPSNRFMRTLTLLGLVFQGENSVDFLSIRLGAVFSPSFSNVRPVEAA